MEYEWDETKNAVNRRKHGIGFEAMDGFAWEYAVHDIHYVDGEERDLVIGPISDKLYSVAIPEREETTRIISLRRATRPEERKWAREARNG